MSDLPRATPTQEVGYTGWPRRGRELPIGSPVVADECSVGVRAKDRRGFLKAATGLNRVHVVGVA
jgi:hypothetical protein